MLVHPGGARLRVGGRPRQGANTLTKSLNEPELRAILGPVLRELPESRSSSRPSKSD